MRLSKVARGQYWMSPITLLTPAPKSSPAQSPLELGESKKVSRFASKTFDLVLPTLFQEPEVPIMVPVLLNKYKEPRRELYGQRVWCHARNLNLHCSEDNSNVAHTVALNLNPGRRYFCGTSAATDAAIIFGVY